MRAKSKKGKNKSNEKNKDKLRNKAERTKETGNEGEGQKEDKGPRVDVWIENKRDDMAAYHERRRGKVETRKGGERGRMDLGIHAM